jgi:E3 ubiquitin-protein ligase BRE1
LTTNEEDTEMLHIELQNLRSKLYCSCKNDREIEVSLKTCPHIFCKKCIDDVTTNRARFCPLCKAKFSKSDINLIKWN